MGMQNMVLTNIQHNVVKGELDNIIGYLFGDTPTLNDLIDFGGSLLCNLVEHRGVWWVEILQSLFLNTSLE